MNTARAYYHGGKPGLSVGDRILPAAETGDEGTLLPYAQAFDEHGAQRTDRVYVTIDRETARAFAAIYPKGDLYRVIPDDPIEIDPSCKVAGLSFQTTGATIVSVYDRCVPKITTKLAARMLYGPRVEHYKQPTTNKEEQE